MTDKTLSTFGQPSDDCAAFVFHLLTYQTGKLSSRYRLRYDFDAQCVIERSDVWSRTSTDGDVSHHRVVAARILEGMQGEELHVFLVPSNVPIIA